MRHGINLSTKLATNFTNHGNHLAGNLPQSLDLSLSSDDVTNPDLAAGQVSLRNTLPNARFLACDDIQFTAIAETAATACEGDLIVYRIGHDDPAKLVCEALARGAVGILTEQLLPCPLPQCIVGDIDLSLASITAEQLGHPDRKLLTVGVIGSAGKTTTALLVSSMLRSLGVRTAYQTDLGESDGIVQSTSQTALPSGAQLIELLVEANDGQCQAAVIELRDDDARYGYYDAIEFDLLIVTGGAGSVKDFGPSGLQCVLDRITPDGVVVAPVDDVKAMQVLHDCQTRYVTYGIRRQADMTAKIIDQSNGLTTLLVTHQDTTAVMETALCGGDMASNLAAAVLTGLLLGQPLHQVVEQVSQLRSVPGRGQRLSDFEHATVIVDAGGTAERVATSLRTQRSMKATGRLWCIVAIDGGESPEMLAQVGNHLERFADQPIITSKVDAKHRFLAGSHAILDGVENCAVFRLVADRHRAIQWAISAAAANDTILIITGQRGQTAHEQRSEIEAICNCVNSSRAESARPKPSAPTLKIFG
jgi:UDP-N-acetylmuramoyl-L-alanyl-D-glutamate--2,6-diaminopimelate ligase